MAGYERPKSVAAKPAAAPVPVVVQTATLTHEDGVESSIVRVTLAQDDAGLRAELQYDYPDLDPVGLSFAVDGHPEYVVTARDGRILTLEVA